MRLNVDGNTDCFSVDGFFKMKLFYTRRFGLIPSTYVCRYDGIEMENNNSDSGIELYKDSEMVIDIEKCDRKTIEEILSDYDIAFFDERTRKKDDDVSCVTEEREHDTIKYQRRSIYAFGTHIESNFTVIIDKLKTIISVESENVRAYYDPYVDIDIESFIDDFIEKLPKTCDTDNEQPSVQLVAFSPDSGYYTIDSEINATNIDIEKNYNDDFKPIYEDIVNFIGSTERKSGLVILNGEPGTGKTYFIRHLITNVPNNYILVPPSIASSLASPEFITFLIENKDSVFILEDCETVIRNRSVSEFSSAVSSVLNMSDGLMSDIFNGKFICTFNADISSVDEAILRKGRCFAKYEFCKLTKDKATSLLKERGFDVEAEDDMTVADIYNYDVREIKKSKHNKIGF